MEISKEARADAVSSTKRYFEENMPEPIGDLSASLLLNFFLEEVGPLIYNRAIADSQARMERYLTVSRRRTLRTRIPILAQD